MLLRSNSTSLTSHWEVLVWSLPDFDTSKSPWAAHNVLRVCLSMRAILIILFWLKFANWFDIKLIVQGLNFKLHWSNYPQTGAVVKRCCESGNACVYLIYPKYCGKFQVQNPCSRDVGRHLASSSWRGTISAMFLLVQLFNWFCTANPVLLSQSLAGIRSAHFRGHQSLAWFRHWYSNQNCSSRNFLLPLGMLDPFFRLEVSVTEIQRLTKLAARKSQSRFLKDAHPSSLMFILCLSMN